MPLGAVADEMTIAKARQINRYRDAVLDRGFRRGHKPVAQMERRQLCIIQPNQAAAETHLRQPRARSDQHGKSARRNFKIKRAMIASLDLIKLLRVIRDNSGEHVEPPRRAFRVCGCQNIRRQRHPLKQLSDIDGTSFEYRAVGQVNFVQGYALKPVFHRAVGAGQKTRPDAPDPTTKPEIKACGLDLSIGERAVNRDNACCVPRADILGWKNA